MKKQPKDNKKIIFCIYASDKKGLIGIVLVHFNKRYYDIRSLNVSRTDISDQVMVTIEAIVPEKEAANLAEKLKKVIEVCAVVVYPDTAGLKKAGFYRLSTAALNNHFWQMIQKYGAVVSCMEEEYMVVQKIGSDDDLDILYSLLEGPHLTGFCRTGLIVEQSLMSFEELEQQ